MKRPHFRFWQRILLTGLMGCLSACEGDGHSHDETGSSCGLEANCHDTLTFMPGLVVTGDSGLAIEILSVEPEPAFESTWTVAVIGSDGNRDPNATLDSVNSWSIDCGHDGFEAGMGVDVIDNGDGTFTFDPDFVHGGPWEVRIAFSSAGTSDFVSPDFCLPETAPHNHG